MFLPALVEDLQCLSPRRFLAAADLAKVQHRPLQIRPLAPTRRFSTTL